jgi:hypothetical protein
LSRGGYRRRSRGINKKIKKRLLIILNMILKELFNNIWLNKPRTKKITILLLLEKINYMKTPTVPLS